MKVGIGLAVAGLAISAYNIAFCSTNGPQVGWMLNAAIMAVIILVLGNLLIERQRVEDAARQRLEIAKQEVVKIVFALAVSRAGPFLFATIPDEVIAKRQGTDRLWTCSCTSEGLTVSGVVFVSRKGFVVVPISIETAVS